MPKARDYPLNEQQLADKALMHRNHAIKISAFYGFLGCALVLVATSRYGIGLSADSVTYLAAAQNIVDGRGYVNFDGAPVLAFPPLFSTLIAVLSAMRSRGVRSLVVITTDVHFPFVARHAPFADDPLVFKKLIYEMRFDEASAEYAEFGPFYVGIRFAPAALGEVLRRGVPGG